MLPLTIRFTPAAALTCDKTVTELPALHAQRRLKPDMHTQSAKMRFFTVTVTDRMYVSS